MHHDDLSETLAIFPRSSIILRYSNNLRNKFEDELILDRITFDKLAIVVAKLGMFGVLVRRSNQHTQDLCQLISMPDARLKIPRRQTNPSMYCDC